MNSISVMLTVVFAFGLPIALAVFYKIKTGVKVLPFVVGIFGFVVFVMFLEALCHQFVIYSGSSLSTLILTNPFAYMAYGALAAGIFEECGRFICYKTVLKKYEEKETSIAYGIGHGGIEVILVLGIGYAAYLPMVMSGMVEPIPLGTCLVAMLERVSALMLHIGLSMVVFAAAREKKLIGFFPLAILIHALADAPAGLYQSGFITSIAVIEAWAFAFGVFALMLGNKALKKREELASSNLSEE